MVTENYPLPRANSWPRVRALLDQALQSPRGISAKLPSWTVAEKVRAAAYKIRDRQRAQSRKEFPDPDDPRHSVSPYDGLSMSIRSALSRTHMELTFHQLDLLPPEEAEELLDAAKRFLSSDPWGRIHESPNPFPSQTVTLKVLVPEGETITTEEASPGLSLESCDACTLAVVRFAPSFKEAWQLIRRDFPAHLIIENGYDTSHLEVQEL